MNNLRIAGLNLDIAWENKAKNFSTIERELSSVPADLYLLPEMFSTGFHMEPAKIADQAEETLTWMKSFAVAANTAVCGSASVAEKGKFYNRMYFVQPDGTVDYYDKRHLFSYAGEDKKYQAGVDRKIVRYKGWRLLLQVCYDLRFPVFARNNSDYDAILYVANWPKSRIDAWSTLLKARAVENQSYVFGLNRTGTDGNNLQYPESSQVFDPLGTEITKRSNNIISSVFDHNQLNHWRGKFPFLDDRDSFTVR